MTPLRNALADYLGVRRALGYKLRRPEKLLDQFLAHLEELGEERVTVSAALTWATLPKDGNPSWWTLRLSAVRGFSVHLNAIAPQNETIPVGLLPWKKCRATPYLYSAEEIDALIVAAGILRNPHRTATYRTLVGLLAVTGMRVGEAIGLDREDVDLSTGVVVVRDGKFGKDRALPLRPSTVKALHEYVRRHDRPRPKASTSALLVSSAGTRLLYGNVQHTFRKLVSRAGLEPRSSRCRPRIHDLRHSFAVQTILDGYRHDGDTQSRLALLSTYLGHVDPGKTYWYLSAAPELMELAGHRLEHHLAGAS
jgi:integrase